MDLTGVQVLQQACYFRPLLLWLILLVGVLGRLGGKDDVKKGHRKSESEPVRRFISGMSIVISGLSSAVTINSMSFSLSSLITSFSVITVFLLSFLKLAELLPVKSAVPASNLLSVNPRELLKIGKVVLQFLPELVHRQDLRDPALVAVMLVHFVRALQARAVFLAEDHVAVVHKVEELVGLVHHVLRTVAVVKVLTHAFIDFFAMPGDGPKLKVNLFHQLLVSGEGNLLKAWFYVDQTTKDATLGISDLHRPIRRHKEEAVCPNSIGAFELFIHQHLLVADNAIQLCVVLNPAQVAIVLDRHQRIAPECLQGKHVVCSSQRLCVKHHVISLKQLLDHVQYCALARPGFAVEHQELLNITAVACHDGPDGPFNLLPLFRHIQCAYQLIPGAVVSLSQRIRQLAGNVIVLADFLVAEGQLLVQLVVIITDVGDVAPVVQPCVVAEVQHIFHMDHVRNITDFFLLFTQVFVHHPLHVILIRAPHAFIAVPDSVECFAPHHQVLASAYPELGININASPFRAALLNCVKVHGSLRLLLSALFGESITGLMLPAL